MNIKPNVQSIALALLALSTLNPQLSTAYAQGTTFSYEGRLNDVANPATGIYDLRFTVYDAAGAGTLIAGPLTNSATGVTNGLFVVTLDFGPGIFNGADRWLEINVRTNGAGTFTPLTPRQKILPVPYAMYSGNAATSASYSGPVALSQLPSSVALLNSNQVFTGTVMFSNPSNSFAGSGAGLNSVRFTTLDGAGIETLRYGTFVQGNYFNPTSNPVATGDMNGDGRIDLICFQNQSGSLLVLTNDGNSSFGLQASYGPGISTGYVVVTDVNGDGKPDVVTTAGDFVTVYTNTGNGTLVFASSSPTGHLPGPIATADFNNDGRPDVVTADLGASTLTVLTNNGNAGFGIFTTLTGVGPYLQNVIAVDVNGDHRPDIISCQLSQSIYTGNLTVFTNSGSGFVFASTPVTGVNPLQVAAVDLNGDGHMDLVSADYGAFGGSQAISILINDGSGNFTSYPALVGAMGPTAIATADVNGDGKPDIICLNAGTNSAGPWSISVLTNDGGGYAYLASTLPGAAALVIGDVNTDGRPDIISASLATNGNSVVDVPDVWFNDPVGLWFEIPVIAQSSLTVNGVAALNNPANTFNGYFTGNGAGLAGLNAGNISSGTLADTRLSANVALRAGGNTFTNIQTYNGQIRLDSTDGFSQSSVGVFSIDLPFKAGQRFMVLTNGNVGMGIANPTNKLHVIGGATFTSGNAGANQSVIWTPGSASWSFTSDRNTKDRVEPVNPQSVLERLARLRIAEWSYIGYEQRHIGPMAQDFHAQFPLNGDDKALNDADLHGVALAAIQGLNQKVEAKESRIQEQESRIQNQSAEITELKQRLETLEKIILNQKSN